MGHNCHVDDGCYVACSHQQRRACFFPETVFSRLHFLTGGKWWSDKTVDRRLRRSWCHKPTVTKALRPTPASYLEGSGSEAIHHNGANGEESKVGSCVP